MRLVALVLEEAGYGVRMASDGCHALEAVEINMPDLILLDMMMPHMDGSVFAGAFKAKYGGQTPIVLLRAEGDLNAWAEKMGAVTWLRKPFDLDELVTVVNTFLN